MVQSQPKKKKVFIKIILHLIPLPLFVPSIQVISFYAFCTFLYVACIGQVKIGTFEKPTTTTTIFKWNYIFCNVFMYVNFGQLEREWESEEEECTNINATTRRKTEE